MLHLLEDARAGRAAHRRSQRWQSRSRKAGRGSPTDSRQRSEDGRLCGRQGVVPE